MIMESRLVKLRFFIGGVRSRPDHEGLVRLRESLVRIRDGFLCYGMEGMFGSSRKTHRVILSKLKSFAGLEL